MNFSDIPKAATLPPRQASLFNLVEAAQDAAAEAGETLYIIHAPFYVDEHAEGEHVYSSKEAAAYIYPKREGIVWEINASVEPDGSVFFTLVEDALVLLSHSTAEQRKITVEVLTDGAPV